MAVIYNPLPPAAQTHNQTFVAQVLPSAVSAAAPISHLNEDSPAEDIVAFKHQNAQHYLAQHNPESLTHTQTQQIEKALQDYAYVYGHNLHIKGKTPAAALQAITDSTLTYLKAASDGARLGVESDYAVMIQKIVSATTPSDDLMDRFFAGMHKVPVQRPELNALVTHKLVAAAPVSKSPYKVTLHSIS